jgi:hypothetical protein
VGTFLSRPIRPRRILARVKVRARIPTLLALACACSSSPSPPPAWTGGPLLLPGEKCDPQNATPLSVRFDPPSIVLAPGQTRSVRLTIEPDVCAPMQGTFSVEAPADRGSEIATTPANPNPPFDLRHATLDFTLRGERNGTTTLHAKMTRASDQSSVDGTLPIEVRDGTPPSCGGNAGPLQTQTIDGGHATFAGTRDLQGAELGAPAGAFVQSDVEGNRKLPPFPATMACATDLAPSAPGTPVKLGPAITFGAGAPLDSNKVQRRELDFAIPINPASFPSAARLRHLQVLFSSPRAKTPRAIPVANPRIERATASAGAYVLRFSSPWLGTYQPAVAVDSGLHHHTRKLTHRAVLGISEGAVGSSTFVLRHHDKFDAVVPLGGPADWTWAAWFVEKYILGGFCAKNDPALPNCPTFTPNAYPIDEPIAHTMDFNHLFYQDGQGNGGGFPRSEYFQLFLDLAIMLGNGNGQNADPALSFFPAGPTAKDPWVTGDTTGLPPGSTCAVAVDPYAGPNQNAERQIETQCNKSRCDPKRTWIAPKGYYDARFNPDGSQQVISICDGNQSGTSPYDDTWVPPTPDTAWPVDVALAVDYNRNGIRDVDEPVLQQGHESYDDTGADGVFDKSEPGYDPVNNPDPAQDDYDRTINPGGTEGDHRYEAGEPFRDYGLDGVPNTATSPYDFGENDGKYTESKGRATMYANDPHSILRGWVTDLPGGAMTDDELARISIFADGGVRDLFNFAVWGNHFLGAIGARHHADGTRVKSTAFYNDFDYLPGETIGQPEQFTPSKILWADVPEAVMLRFGSLDATAEMIAAGDGQHVGTPAQLVDRLQAGLGFIDHKWPDIDRIVTNLGTDNPETTTNNVLGVQCELAGQCQTTFTGPKTGRSGPVIIQLPPGYANEDSRLRDVRYPVVYVLHGYGQDPSDVEASATFTTNLMNDGSRSYATRMGKFIMVYLDGRCRNDAKGQPECVRGTFWLNSVRPGGPQMETWFEEVMDYVDANYRTMGEGEVDVTE